MHAIVQDQYGPVDLLEPRDVEAPTIAEDEVLVRVHAAGIDRGVWHLVTGLPYLTRLVAGVRRPKAPVPGTDLAGIVEAVGRDVTRFRPGDAVFGTGRGTYAEFAVAPEATLAHAPSSVRLELAAVLGVTGSTALQAVRDHARVQRGQRVLVLGASGGVGTFVVQLAKAAGAEVTGVASTAKLDLVRSLGTDHVIDYTRHDALAGSRRYDAIIDTGGNSPLRRLRRALTPTGTLVIVGGEGGGRLLGGFDRQLRAKLWSSVLRQRLTTFIAQERADDLVELATRVDAGLLDIVASRTFTLAEVPKALRHLEEGHVRGKAVVVIEHGPPSHGCLGVGATDG